MRSKVLCVSNILSTAYVIYLMFYFFGSTSSASGTEAIGYAILGALLMPHIIMILTGTVFGWLGFLLKRAGRRLHLRFYMQLVHCSSLHILCLESRY